jgi:hypothetical protein
MFCGNPCSQSLVQWTLVGEGWGGGISSNNMTWLCYRFFICGTDSRQWNASFSTINRCHVTWGMIRDCTFYFLRRYISQDLRIIQSRRSSVGMATGYRFDGQGSILGRGKRFLSTLQRPDRPWGSPNLGGKAAEVLIWPLASFRGEDWWSCTSKPHIRLHGVVLN